MKILLVAISLSLLAGCASQPSYQGHGEYFELKKRNVVYRDLTVPSQPGNENKVANIETFPAAL